MSNVFRLFRIASREIPFTHQDRAEMIDALRSALVDPSAPSLDLNEEQFRRLEREVSLLDALSWERRDEARIVACMHAREIFGWDPFLLPRMRACRSHTQYIPMRDAVAVLCIAAQIVSDQKPLILTADDLKPVLAMR
jgi:hypothetical protein